MVPVDTVENQMYDKFLSGYLAVYSLTDNHQRDILGLDSAIQQALSDIW